jgi:hypothetical protein
VAVLLAQAGITTSQQASTAFLAGKIDQVSSSRRHRRAHRTCYLLCKASDSLIVMAINALVAIQLIHLFW